MHLFSLPFSDPQPQSKSFPQSLVIGLNVKQEIPGEGWSIIELDIISVMSVSDYQVLLTPAPTWEEAMQGSDSR